MAHVFIKSLQWSTLSMTIIRMVNGRIISIPQSFIRFCSQLCLLQWTRQKILPLLNQWSELRSIIKYSSNETHCYTDDEHSKEAHSGMRIYLINIFKDQEKLTRFQKQNWEEWRKDRLQSGCIREEKWKEKRKNYKKSRKEVYSTQKGLSLNKGPEAQINICLLRN